MSYLPRFQAQNPEISHYALGWSSCTAYSTAMQIDAASAGTKRPTGAQVRAETGDTSGGLNLAQVDLAAQDGWGIDLDVRYRYPWDSFVYRVNRLEQSAQLQGWYAPIAISRFDAGHGFKGNHDILVMPGLITLDPLADGRYPDVYDYRGEDYPATLLRSYAGKLNLGDTTYRALGDGFVYAAFHDVGVEHVVTIRPRKGETRREYVRYPVETVNGHRRIVGRSSLHSTTGFEAACTPVKRVLTATGRTVGLVKVLEGGYRDIWVSEAWEHIE